MSTPAPPPHDRPYGQDPTAPANPPPPGYPGAPQPYPGGGPGNPGGYPHGGPVQPYGYAPPYSPDQRPGTVTAAAWITIGLSILGALGGLAFAVGADALTDFMRDNRDDLNLSSSDLDNLQDARVGFVLFGIVFIAAALAAIGLAVLVLKRQNWARIVLVVLSGISVLIGLILTFAAVIGIFWFIGAIAVIILLFVGGANEWFSREPAQGPPPGSPSGAPQPYQGW